jgi:hypothetical protein
MAWTAPSTFVAGAILTAAQLNTNVRDNSLAGGPIYATEALRDAAIPSPFEGQRAYITGPTIPATTGTTASLPTGIQTVYNGAVWVCLTSVGVGTAGASATFGTSFANVTVAGIATSVTLVTGTTALVSYAARVSGTGNFCQISVKSGTVAASNSWASMNQVAAYVTVGMTFVMPGLTAGTNTFTLQGQQNVAGGSCDQIQLSVQGIA